MASFSIEHDKKLLIPYIKAAKARQIGHPFLVQPLDAASVDEGQQQHRRRQHEGGRQDAERPSRSISKSTCKRTRARASRSTRFIRKTSRATVLRIPSCGWTGALYIKFIRDFLGPLFAQDKVPAQIWCGTMSNQTDGTIATNLASDAKAMSYVKGFGLQWNTRASSPP